MDQYHNRQLYVVTCVFNPGLFRSRTLLYHQFAAHMKACGVKLFTVEAAFGDHPFKVTCPDNPWHLQLRTWDILWHKERLMTLGLQRLVHLVPLAKYFGWFDADTTFANPDFAEETVHQLMRHPVVQPYSHAINLNSKEEPMWTCPSTFAHFVQARGYHREPPPSPSYLFKGHPGLAWAATREALNQLGGLYDACVSGSGDTVMANCLKGKWDAYLPSRPSAGMVRSIRRWADRCDRHIHANVGYTRGVCLHHWHGASESRGYERRWSILEFHQFDPDEDITLDVNGLYRWAGNKPKLESDIRLSLTSRNEDAL